MQPGAVTTDATGDDRSRAATAAASATSSSPAEGGSGKDGARVRDRWTRLAVLAVAAVVASPVVLAGVSLAAERWYPIGDLAHMVFRTSQVGTADTPLVGAYTVKGWAHPGPLPFWLPAPLYRLLGEDPRALEWTAGIVNVACIVALCRVAWRRGGLPLVLAVGTFTALLVQGLSPELLVSAWNPFVPLFPFLLTIVLVWDAALGRRRAMVEAVIPASIAMQGHLAFVALVAVLAVWLYCWCRWWPRLLPDAPAPAGDGRGSDGGEGSDGTGTGADVAALPRPPWARWYGSLRYVVLAVAVLWIGPVVDLVVDLHNPVTILKSVATPPAAVGPLNAVGLVGRYVRPDGPWLGGAEPQSAGHDVLGSGPLPFLLALAVVGGCVHVARRRGLVDVLALSTMTLTLLLGSLPATSQIVLPAFHYLTQWLKIIGCLVWLTAAWTGWRVLEPHVRASRPRRRLAAGLATGALVAAAAISWPEANALEHPLPDESRAVQELRARLSDVLPDDQRVRVEPRGDLLANAAPGVIYWLIEDGHDVVTSDGYVGLKWGHDHRWDRGDDFDLLVTVAMNSAVDQCALDPRARELAAYDAMSAEDRAWYLDAQFRRLAGPDALTDAEERRMERLAADDLRLAAFAGPRICAEDPEWEVGRPRDASVAPVLGGVAAATAVAAALVVRHRRRARPTT